MGSAQTLVSITADPPSITGIANDVDSVFIVGHFIDGSTQLLNPGTMSITNANPAVASVTPTTTSLQVNLLDQVLEGLSNITVVDVVNGTPFQVSIPVEKIHGGSELGIPTFSTQNRGGPVDTLDLATDNVHFEIPIRSKTGKIPFSFSLQSNSVAYVVGSGKTAAWEIQTGFTGTTNSILSASLEVSQTTLSTYCTGFSEPDIKYSPISVVDPSGALHTLYTSGTGKTLLATDSEGCKYGNVTGVTVDGSGYTVYVNYTDVGMLAGLTTIYDIHGNHMSRVLTNNNTITRTMTDTDGVSMTEVSIPNYSTNTVVDVYTDTLGAIVLQTARANPPGPTSLTDTYEYLDSSGTTLQQSVVNYAQANKQTAFGCSAVTDTKPYSLYVPVSIQLPPSVGGEYQILYEEPYNITNGNITGRIGQVTYPALGTVTYTYTNVPTGYTGVDQGINCTDLTTVPEVDQQLVPNQAAPVVGTLSI